MSCLAPCPACKRHVSSDETACPFCLASLPASFACQPRSSQPSSRLSRAAKLAAGAALMSAEACGSPVVPYGTPPPPPVDAAVDTGTANDSAIAAPAPLEQAPLEHLPAPPPSNKKKWGSIRFWELSAARTSNGRLEMRG
jgi:hypothetical protein